MGTIIREAPLGVFLAMVGVPLAMAAVAVIAGWHARRQAAAVTRTKAVPIGMAEDGYRRFEGTVEAIGAHTLIAPLTGSECVWYSAKVERWQRPLNAPRRFDWVTVRAVTSSTPLLLRDRTGACVVRLFGAEVTPTDRSQWTGATLDPVDRDPPRVGPAQSTHGMLQVSGGPNSGYRYTEQRIYPGDPLLVVGLYRSHRFDEAPALDDVPPEPTAVEPAGTTVKGATRLGREADAGPTRQASGQEPSDPWRGIDEERHDTLTALAEGIAKADIQRGGRGQPLVVSATTAATHVAMSELGGQAAFTIALVPLAIAAFVLLARFG